MRSVIPLAFLLFTFLATSAAAIPGDQGTDAEIDIEPYAAPPPEGYIHRPLMEFFTGLSCPSCMGDGPDDDSPHKAVHDSYLDGMTDPEAPFSTVVFHELNGGGEDDLNTDEATERMRFYQPGLSGTPDVQFDGGYIEIGGFSASNKPIDGPTIDWALSESEQRDQNAPIRPLDRLQWSFPYVTMEVDQIFEGTSFTVIVKATYESNAKMVGGNLLPLQGSMYVFMVEDNVTAYSLVYDMNITNDAVFRGYAAEDERFTLSNGGEQTFTYTFDIPDAKIPIKPQNMRAVAAIFDTQDTESSPGGTDGNQRANSPRCVQSATSRSTAYDRGNKPPEVSSISLDGDTVTVSMDDEGGISRAFLFLNREGPGVPVWEPVELKVTGEEVCDDSGVCYAYSDATGTAQVEDTGDGLYAQVLMYDDQFAQESSEVYTLVEARDTASEKGAAMVPISAGSLGLFFGLLLIVAGPVLYLMNRNRKQGQLKILSSKGTLAVIVAIGIIITSISASSVFTESTSTVPDFTVTDTEGNVHTPEKYEGKTLVIDIMFTTCSGCIAEMPDLVEVYGQVKEKYGDDVKFLSVSVDNEDTNRKMDDFQDRFGATWPIGRNRDFVEIFDALAVPKMIIVSPTGDIVYEHTNIIDKDTVLEKIDDSESGDYNSVSITQSGGSLIAFGSMAMLFGIMTFFSPCSLPMLPGYVSYYVSQETSGKKRINPLMGGILASVGIIAFFLIIGVLVVLLGGIVQSILPYLMLPIGALILIFGFLMFIERDAFLEKGMEMVKRPFETLFSRVSGGRTNSEGAGGLFTYGFGYGAAASSCMAPAFLTMVLLALTAGGIIGAALIFGVYTLAIGAMMVLFTYLAASGSRVLERFVSNTSRIKKISAVLLMVAGLFIVLYVLFLEKYMGAIYSFGG